MNLLLAPIKRIVPSFNKRPHTVDDFWRICRRLSPYVRVHEIPLAVRGYSMIEEDGRPHIYINNRLKGLEWLETAFHELGHIIMHKPVLHTKTYYHRMEPPTKQEHEAQAFAEIMLIPQKLMFQILESPDYIEEWGFAEKLFGGRCELFARYAV